MFDVPSILKLRHETQQEDSYNDKTKDEKRMTPVDLEWREEEHTQYRCHPKRFRVDLKEGYVWIKSLWPILDGEHLLFRGPTDESRYNTNYIDCIPLSNLKKSVSKSVHLKQVYVREVKSVYERKWVKWTDDDHWRSTNDTRNRTIKVEEAEVDEEPTGRNQPHNSIHNMVMEDE